LVQIDHADVEAGGVCQDHRTIDEDLYETAMCDAYHDLGCSWYVPDYLHACSVARMALRRADGSIPEQGT
jgi:hypothetical protein